MTSGTDGSPASSPRLRAQARLVDQGASMQASLRDAYAAIGTGLALVVLVLSALALAFAFAGGDASVTILGVTAQRATWLGWLAFGTFALTLVDLLTDPRGAARRRGEAVKAYAALKDDLRAALADPRPEPARDRRLSERYAEVSALAPPVPNSLFNYIKARHLRKVEISKILSERPGISVRAAKRTLNDRLREQPSAGRPDSSSLGHAP